MFHSTGIYPFAPNVILDKFPKQGDSPLGDVSSAPPPNTESDTIATYTSQFFIS